MIKRSIQLVVSTCFFFLLFFGVVNAEARLNPIKSTDTHVTGTAKANQRLMLFHKDKWLKTEADDKGNFHFDLSSVVGESTLHLESEDDGDFIREESITPEPDKIEVPLYLGKRDGEWIFYGKNGELSVLIDGKVYNGHGLLHVPVTDVTEAKAYISWNGKRSQITTLDLSHPPIIPFELTESPADGRRITGKTLPYQSIRIAYTGVHIPDYQGNLNFDQLIVADEEGYFDSPLTVLLPYRNDVSYQLSLPKAGKDAVLENLNGEKRSLPDPKVDAVHPLTTVSEDHFWLSNTIKGMTFPNHSIYLKKKDGTFKLCTTANSTGYFACQYDYETYPVELSVFSPSNKLIVTKKIEIAPYTNDRWSITIDSITNESEILTGTALPHSTLTISYYGKNPFILKTKANELGNFQVDIPRRAGGTYVVNGKSTYRGINYTAIPESVVIYDLRPLSTPTYAFHDGMLTVYAQHKKVTDLSAELSIIHTDGSFEAKSLTMSSSSGTSSSQSASLNKGDHFTIYLRDSSGMKSASISGEYIPFEQPVLEKLSNRSTEIIGKTVPDIWIHYYTQVDGEYKLNTITTDAEGNFRIPLSTTYRPQQIFAETQDQLYFVSINLFYEYLPPPDTTPPILKLRPFNQGSTSFSWTNDDGVLLTFRFHYRNGTIEEEVLHDGSREGKWTHNKNLYDVVQVEVTATDEAGNISEPIYIKPIDTTPPLSAKVNRSHPGATTISGTAEIDSTVRVTYAGKIYKSQTSKTGIFSVQVPTLRTGDSLSVRVVDESGNLSLNATEITIIGVKKMTISTDRKILTLETNASYWNPLNFRLEGAIKTDIISINKVKWSYSLKKSLPNHSVIHVQVANSEKVMFNIFEQKFSDTIVPSAPSLLPITTTSASVAGTAEPFSTVLITFNDKTYQTIVDAKGNFLLSQRRFIAGTEVSAITRDPAGNLSPKSSTIVRGILSLGTTKLTSRSTSISSQATPAAIVTLYKSGKQLQRVTASKTGAFKLTLPKQKVGTKLILKVTKSKYTTLVRTITVTK
ncbi:Ig-like domain-containing protein [Exiguobacterium acetylicum]|uniref:Ig-like domain-containing protein n=1 Tax=Exiguobacterium acetylicum TaxID=41170 RepID=UPI003876A7A7